MKPLKSHAVVYCGPGIRPGPEVREAVGNMGWRMIVEVPEALCRRCRQEKPVAVIVEISSQPMAGLVLIHRLKSDPRTRNIPLLCVAWRKTEQDALDAFEAGADECVHHPINAQVLSANLVAVLRRYKQRGPQSMRPIEAGPLKLDMVHCVAYLRGRLLKLTAAEFAILELLARHRPSPVLRKTVLDHIQKTFGTSSPHTIETHMANLRRKLSPNGRLVETIYGIGYRLA